MQHWPWLKKTPWWAHWTAKSTGGGAGGATGSDYVVRVGLATAATLIARTRKQALGFRKFILFSAFPKRRGRGKRTLGSTAFGAEEALIVGLLKCSYCANKHRELSWFPFHLLMDHPPSPYFSGELMFYRITFAKY